MLILLEPILERLPPSEKITITSENVKLSVFEEAERITSEIKKEVQETKLVSVKVDIASRHGRSFLGLNLQFISREKLSIRTLGVEEITEKHSGENLKNLMFKIFDSFELSVQSIYSFTSDNATNMIKLCTLLDKEINSQIELLYDLETIGDDELIERNTENEEDNRILNSLQECTMLLPGSSIINIQCAAHTVGN
ncbi:unnamed protein product [Brassicogethes aeneus]|uniref:Uncharacterized protein n=1 Tax=Brassicogethes aeneus TaxID=1431903 RepID=A0A9P0BH57_BRAAE|nr:unnamed protein product [Brassicogethes aeneus]